MLDRTGAALDVELSVEHVLTELITLGVELAPAWFGVGERILGGIGGGMTSAHLLFTSDVLAVGFYAGVAAIPRPGTPLAGILGLRIRLGFLDYVHADFRGSLAYSDVLGVNSSHWNSTDPEHTFDVQALPPFLPTRFGFPHAAQDLFFNVSTVSYSAIPDSVFALPSSCLPPSVKPCQSAQRHWQQKHMSSSGT